MSDCGHGHVHKRADGMLARCGGPTICRLCAIDRVEQVLNLDELLSIYEPLDLGDMLTHKQACFGGQRPIDMLDSPEGTRRLVDGFRRLLDGGYL